MCSGQLYLIVRATAPAADPSGRRKMLYFTGFLALERRKVSHFTKVWGPQPGRTPPTQILRRPFSWFKTPL